MPTMVPDVPSTYVLAAGGVLLAVFLLWRSGVRRAKAAAEATRTGARFVSLAGRVLFNAGLITAMQWAVVTHRPGGWLLLAVLGFPALFASYTLTKALTVTTVDTTPRRSGGRR